MELLVWMHCAFPSQILCAGRSIFHPAIIGSNHENVPGLNFMLYSISNSLIFAAA